MMYRWKAPAALTAVILLLLLRLCAPAGAEVGTPPRAPDLEQCPELKVEGERVAFHAYAEGVQIYRWNGTNWIFQRPEAWLFADAGGHGRVGSHYVGPTWEARDGSKVVAAVDKRCEVEGTIPWLLLRATATEGPGLFHRVSSIQRVNTAGGTAPEEAGTFIGQEAGVPYTSEYYFYRKG